MQIGTKSLLPFFMLVLLLTIACSGEPPASRQDVLVSLTDELIVPRFAAVAGEMGELRDAVHALCATPNADTLDAAQIAWREARAPWMRSQALWFGPVMERRSRTLVDWSPIDPDRIEKLLAERVNLRTGRSGFPGVHPAWSGIHRIRTIRRRPCRSREVGPSQRDTLPISDGPGRRRL